MLHASLDINAQQRWINKEFPGILEKYTDCDICDNDTSLLFEKGNLCKCTVSTVRYASPRFYAQTCNIRQSAKSHCFWSARKVPVCYSCNIKAWIMQKGFPRMAGGAWCIHHVYHALLRLPCAEVLFLPLNTTMSLQPMNVSMTKFLEHLSLQRFGQTGMEHGHSCWKQ